MNTNYGKLANGQITYAPDTLTVDGALKMNPSAASYLAAGYKKIVDDPPEPESGKDVVFSSWTETDTTLVRVYKQIDHEAQSVETTSASTDSTSTDSSSTSTSTSSTSTSSSTSTIATRTAAMASGAAAATPAVGARVFSKLKLVTALKAADKWVLVKTWLEEKSYYDYYLAAQEFHEDNDLFKEALAALKTYARVTDDEAEEILAKSVAD